MPRPHHQSTDADLDAACEHIYTRGLKPTSRELRGMGFSTGQARLQSAVRRFRRRHGIMQYGEMIERRTSSAEEQAIRQRMAAIKAHGLCVAAGIIDNVTGKLILHRRGTKHRGPAAGHAFMPVYSSFEGTMHRGRYVYVNMKDREPILTTFRIPSDFGHPRGGDWS